MTTELIREGAVVEIPAAYEPGEDVIGDLDDSLRADLNHVLNELGEEADKTEVMLKLYRVKPENGKSVFLFDAFDPTGDYVKKCRDEYGSGDYEARIFLNKRLKKRSRFSVEVAKITDSKSDPEVSRLINHLIERDNQREREMREMRREPVTDPKKDLIETLALVREMSGSRTDVVAILGAVSPFLVPFISGLSDKLFNGEKADPFGNLEKIVGIAKQLGGGKGGESSLLDKLTDAMPMVFDALKATQGANQNREQLGAVAPQPTPVSPTPQKPTFVPAGPAPVFPIKTSEPEQPPTQNGDPMNLQYTMALQHLCGKARDFERPNHGEDIDEIASSVLSMIPDANFDDFINMIERPDAVDSLAKYHAGVLDHRVWFEGLRDAILAQVDAEESTGDTDAHDTANATNGDPGRPTGNPGDAKNHAESGEPGQDKS